MAEKYSDVTAFAQPSSEQLSSHDSSNEYPRTVAVVVTYNREDLLPKTLAGIASGERVPATAGGLHPSGEQYGWRWRLRGGY